MNDTINYIMGDLLSLAKTGQFDVIAHGCNCQHNFGAGIAKQLKFKFPESFQADLQFDNPKLGQISKAYSEKHKIHILNCYTQIWYGKPFELNSKNNWKDDTSTNRYNAIRQCMKLINLEFKESHVGLPLIGCGLAGLDWSRVEKIIQDELVDLRVTVVKYQKINSIAVVNKHTHKPTKNDIYIGRGSVLGNPYTSIKNKKTKAKYVCKSRDESIKSFEEYINQKIKNKDPKICNELNRIWKLAKYNDVNLVCFCSPKPCHGDIIKRIIESRL